MFSLPDSHRGHIYDRRTRERDRQNMTFRLLYSLPIPTPSERKSIPKGLLRLVARLLYPDKTKPRPLDRRWGVNSQISVCPVNSPDTRVCPRSRQTRSLPTSAPPPKKQPCSPTAWFTNRLVHQPPSSAAFLRSILRRLPPPQP